MMMMMGTNAAAAAPVRCWCRSCARARLCDARTYTRFSGRAACVRACVRNRVLVRVRPSDRGPRGTICVPERRSVTVLRETTPCPRTCRGNRGTRRYARCNSMVAPPRDRRRRCDVTPDCCVRAYSRQRFGSEETGWDRVPRRPDPRYRRRPLSRSGRGSIIVSAAGTNYPTASGSSSASATDRFARRRPPIGRSPRCSAVVLTR